MRKKWLPPIQQTNFCVNNDCDCYALPEDMREPRCQLGYEIFPQIMMDHNPRGGVKVYPAGRICRKPHSKAVFRLMLQFVKSGGSLE